MDSLFRLFALDSDYEDLCTVLSTSDLHAEGFRCLLAEFELFRLSSGQKGSIRFEGSFPSYIPRRQAHPYAPRQPGAKRTAPAKANATWPSRASWQIKRVNKLLLGQSRQLSWIKGRLKRKSPKNLLPHQIRTAESSSVESCCSCGSMVTSCARGGATKMVIFSNMYIVPPGWACG